MRRGRDTPEERPWEAQGEGDPHTPNKKGLPRSQFWWHLGLGLPSCWLWENKCLMFKPPSLWCFVTVALPLRHFPSLPRWQPRATLYAGTWLWLRSGLGSLLYSTRGRAVASCLCYFQSLSSFNALDKKAESVCSKHFSRLGNGTRGWIPVLSELAWVNPGQIYLIPHLKMQFTVTCGCHWAAKKWNKVGQWHTALFLW